MEKFCLCKKAHNEKILVQFRYYKWYKWAMIWPSEMNENTSKEPEFVKEKNLLIHCYGLKLQKMCPLCTIMCCRMKMKLEVFCFINFNNFNAYLSKAYWNFGILGQI